MYSRKTALVSRMGVAVAALGLAAGALGACSTSSTPSATRPASQGTSSPSTASTSGTSGTSGTTGTSGTAATSVALTVQTGKMDGKPGWPRFVPADLSVAKGVTVTLTITSYDNGTAPLPASTESYDKVQGGTETVNGSAVTSIPNAELAHTFTVPSLGVNVPIPAVQAGQTSVQVVFTFVPTKSGSFTWLCMAPSGTGASGMGGPMMTPGWMRGTITVA